jgi:hypothetical protein
MNTLRTRLIALTLFSALAGATGNAQAEAHGMRGITMHGGGGGGGHGFGQGFPHRGYVGHGGGGYRGGYGGGWVAPLLGAAIVGGAIYATMPPVQQPQVIYPQQPAVITDPSRVRYYCQPYQQFYPNVTQCPAPWQVVPF